MKAKKAVKRLDKVVAILSDVIKQYAPSERHVRELFGAAKASVVRAKAAVNSSASPRTARDGARLRFERPLETCNHPDASLALQHRAQLHAPMLVKEGLPPMARAQLGDQYGHNLS